MGELFTKNYDELYLVAKRITQRKDYRLAPVLISETYIDTQNKAYPNESRDFVKWFSKCMKQQFYWKNSVYNINKEVNVKKDFDEHTEDEHALNDLNLKVEDTNQETKELIEVSSGMKTARMLKYIQVLEFKETLLLHEKYLFELYFVNGLSSRAIAEKLDFDIHFKNINKMVNEIKLKIKQYKWK